MLPNHWGYSGVLKTVMCGRHWCNGSKGVWYILICVKDCFIPNQWGDSGVLKTLMCGRHWCDGSKGVSMGHTDLCKRLFYTQSVGDSAVLKTLMCGRHWCDGSKGAWYILICVKDCFIPNQWGIVVC